MQLCYDSLFFKVSPGLLPGIYMRASYYPMDSAHNVQLAIGCVAALSRRDSRLSRHWPFRSILFFIIRYHHVFLTTSRHNPAVMFTSSNRMSEKVTPYHLTSCTFSTCLLEIAAWSGRQWNRFIPPHSSRPAYIRARCV